MKRRNFVRGLLGLTGIAASGASISIEPKKIYPKLKPGYNDASKTLEVEPWKDSVIYNVGDKVFVDGKCFHIKGTSLLQVL